jgi:molybdate transport system substrate-binding protein
MRKIYLLLFLSISLVAGEIYIAGGAGYKRPLSELAIIFEADTKIKLNPIFGNMQQITEQMKHSDKIAVFFGDKQFINKLQIEYKKSVELGKGSLVLVYSKNNGELSTIDDLKSDKVKKIGLPDTKKAIYGVASEEFLTNSNLKASLQDKLNVFQTVPQVSSYIISGDIDAGFINKTDYLSIAKDVGQMVEIDSSLYSPIKIVGVVISGKENSDIDKLFEFLQTPKAKETLKKHGL